MTDVEDLIDAVRREKRAVSDEGRPDAVEKQHEQGKLTARERVDHLCSSFDEIGQLAAPAPTTPETADWEREDAPADGVVAGVGDVRKTTPSSSAAHQNAERSEDGVAFYGAEGGGEGTDTVRHAAPLDSGTEDVLHGMRTRVIEDDVDVHSVSAGLDYPGVGPEHAMFRAVGRCEYRGVTDDDALRAFRTLAETEGIIPALETSHALALAEEIADDHDTIVVNLSGRGDKDMQQAAELFDLD